MNTATSKIWEAIQREKVRYGTTKFRIGFDRNGRYEIGLTLSDKWENEITSTFATYELLVALVG